MESRSLCFELFHEQHIQLNSFQTHPGEGREEEIVEGDGDDVTQFLQEGATSDKISV